MSASQQPPLPNPASPNPLDPLLKDLKANLFYIKTTQLTNLIEILEQLQDQLLPMHKQRLLQIAPPPPQIQNRQAQNLQVQNPQLPSKSLDIRAEVQANLRALAALRESVAQNPTPQNYKNLVVTATSAFNQMMRFQETLDHEARLKRIEQAVKAAIAPLPKETRDSFLRTLEGKLNAPAFN